MPHELEMPDQWTHYGIGSGSLFVRTHYEEIELVAYTSDYVGGIYRHVVTHLDPHGEVTVAYRGDGPQAYRNAIRTVQHELDNPTHR